MNDLNVKDVYENIAYKFDNTRYRCWTTVERILNLYKKNSINCEMGCGNGKNMIYRNDINFIGVDFCEKFIEICKKKKLNCYVEDIRNTHFEDNYFDNCISIAVIHHLDSIEKRVAAINEMFRVTKINGTLLIYVWALMDPNGILRDNKVTKPDNLVPFKNNDNSIFKRYYHHYINGELNKEISKCNYNYIIIENGYEKGNYYIYLRKT